MSVPSSARLLARAYSPDLTEIIRDVNKYSNNTMAKQLFLSLGAAFRNEADADDAKAAQRVIRQWLAKKGLISRTGDRKRLRPFPCRAGQRA